MQTFQAFHHGKDEIRSDEMCDYMQICLLSQLKVNCLGAHFNNEAVDQEVTTPWLLLTTTLRLNC